MNASPSSHYPAGCTCPHSYCICGQVSGAEECPRCHGSGEIGWNPSPINDPQCALEAPCNVCHGQGVLHPLAAEAYRLGWVEEVA